MYSQKEYNSLVVGRGATAIYLALHELHDKEIIVPSNICYAAIFPIFYSGNIPRFIDVDYPSGNATCEQIEEAINPNTGAVLYPHMYGNISPEMTKIRQLCDQYNIVLIEDCASAMGGEYSDSIPVGAYGDYVIFSTGHGKTVDLDNGGLLLTQKSIDTITATYNSLPLFSKDISTKQKEFSQKYSLAKHNNDDQTIKTIFSKIDDYKDQFLYRIDDPLLIKQIEKSFDAAIDIKNKKLPKYNLYLQNLPREICYQYNNGSIPWRFSALIKDKQKRQLIIDALLEKQLFVSDWYPCIGRFFDSKQTFNNAMLMESQILNFDLLIPDQDILIICDIIKTILVE